jgi:poly(3-hydroxybutyrate) depolymerase
MAGVNFLCQIEPVVFTKPPRPGKRADHPQAVVVAALTAIGLVCISAFAGAAPALPAYHADPGKTSVSGLSSGAFMAAQFHVAFSRILVGAGIIAGGPFYCAGASPFTSLENASTICMSPPPGFAPPDAARLLKEAKIFAQSGDIDDLNNLKSQRVYLFTGTKDKTVHPAVVDQTAAFYRLAGVPEKNIKYINNIVAGHSIITDNSKDSDCPVTAPPYINDCHFTQSQDILNQIYENLNSPASTLSGKIIKFNQGEFIRYSFLSSMSDDAYLYVPKSCEKEICKVHIAFHGCQQGAAQIGERFVRTTGYNELADTNHIIVLYPQAQKSNGFFSAYNPEGCWDFWGYSSPYAPDYYSRKATQMAAVKAMLDRLAQPRKK